MSSSGLQNSPEAQINQDMTIGVTTTLLTLCIISYVVRIVSRKVMKSGLWLDDYWMAFVLLACVEMSILNYLGVSFGSGQHQSDVPPAMLHSFLLNLFVFMFSWAINTALVKIGILLLYWRIFNNDRQFRRLVFVVGAFVIATHTALVFSFIFQCTPVSYFWNPAQAGGCFDQSAFYMSGGSLNIVGDVLVLALPMHMIWKLQTSRSQKLAVSFLFLLGSFVCITSIFRLLAIKLIVPTDFTWTNVKAGVWSTVEVEVGLICANLPQCRPIFLRLFFPGRVRSQSNPPSGGSAAFGPRHRSHMMKMDPDGFERILETKAALDGTMPGTALTTAGDSFENRANAIPLRSIMVETQLEQTESRAPNSLDRDCEERSKTRSVAITTSVAGPTN